MFSNLRELYTPAESFIFQRLMFQIPRFFAIELKSISSRFLLLASQSTAWPYCLAVPLSWAFLVAGVAPWLEKLPGTRSYKLWRRTIWTFSSNGNTLLIIFVLVKFELALEVGEVRGKKGICGYKFSSWTKHLGMGIWEWLQSLLKN